MLTNCNNSSSTNNKDTTKKENTIGDEVTIGTQIWTTKNLNVEVYRNGDTIPQVIDSEEWSSLTKGAWCYYENQTSSGKIYGKLYNYYALTDSRGLAPKGFHIPSYDEWEILYKYLNSDREKAQAESNWEEAAKDYNYVSYKMKSEEGWSTINGYNASGFSALPGGRRNGEDGKFEDIGYNGCWFLTDKNSYFNLSDYGSDMIYSFDGKGTVSENFNVGRSVRCVKD